MKKMWVLIGSLFLGGSVVSSTAAAPAKAETETVSPEAAKAAAIEASSEADKWAASLKSKKAEPEIEPILPAEEPTPVQKNVVKEKPAEAAKPAAPPVQATPAKAAVTPIPKRTGLNEIRGKLLSKSYDPRAIRLVVTGGINVEFAYDPKSSITSSGRVISIEDLGYNDDVVVRYAGKDLYAIEIERLSKAPRPE